MNKTMKTFELNHFFSTLEKNRRNGNDERKNGFKIIEAKDFLFPFRFFSLSCGNYFSFFDMAAAVILYYIF